MVKKLNNYERGRTDQMRDCTDHRQAEKDAWLKVGWNAAVRACQEAVYSDGMSLHPELVDRLEELKK